MKSLYFSLISKPFRDSRHPEESPYLYPVGELPEVIVLSIVENDRIRVVFGELATVQAFLESCQAIERPGQVNSEYKDDNGLDGSTVERGGQIIAEPAHATVFRIVHWIIWIIWVHSSRAERSV